MSFFKSFAKGVDSLGKNIEIAFKTTGGLIGGKSLGQSFTDAVGKSISTRREELTGEQNRLLQKALKEMGLSKGERVIASAQGREGASARSVIESALKSASKFQDGGGRNG
tara:strand:- start:2275 stop:2607 length:333 start_codon:yes stop_codon:yes gene_type:complete